MLIKEVIFIHKLKITSPIPVSVNHYIKPRPYVDKGQPRVAMYETGEAKRYKREFAKNLLSAIKEQNWDLQPNKTQHFYIDCVFYFDRIDMDANNYFKLLLDSITDTQMIWLDDNVTCERVNGIFYDNKNPRIEIEIYPVDYIGIFKNKDMLTLFENRCKECKRYRDKRCSILNKCIEGRIQSEVVKNNDNWDCLKYNKKNVV